MNPTLAALAERCGVEIAYTDIFDEQREAGEDVLRAVLQAMGVEAADDVAAERSLAALEHAHWTRPLQPTLVWRRPVSAASVELRLPERDLARRLRWRLVEEDGNTRTGVVELATLSRTAQITLAGESFVALDLPIEAPASLGYHRLDVGFDGESPPLASARLVLAPERCHQPESLAQGGRIWGAALQTYAVRSARNQGIGDLTDLRESVELFAKLGAGFIGIQPLHALDILRPENASPYAPSTRRFLNVLAIDVEDVDPGVFDDAPELRARLAELRETEWVDYAGVAAVKLPALERLYSAFRDTHLGRGTEADHEFARFRSERGTTLEHFGIFEALREHHLRRDPECWGWPVWPEEYRDPGSAAVSRFAESQRERIEWFLWLQWTCDRQLAAVGRRCMELGLDIGLYLDLSVGFDGAGFDGWWDRKCFALDARYGAPPDAFNLNGQDWGLPPPIPERLREAGYEPFIAPLRENMRHAGAIRIDHVMGLMRAFWVPPGRRAIEGTYVRYPFEDLLALVALESQRQQCLVVGEDLGTVPEGLREALTRAGVLAYRVFYFRRGEDGAFAPPAEYPRDALAAVSTHDMPTLRGWWSGHDLQARRDLGAYPDEETRERQLVERSEDRARLMLWIERAGRLPGSLAGLPGGPAELTDALTRSLHLTLAEAPPMLLSIRPEDVLGQLEPINMPGTGDAEFPNWRRKLPLTLREMATDTRLLDLARAIATTRPGRRPLPEGAIEPRALPRATYRLQLHADFGFEDAAALTDYLELLGISHAYSSPILGARPGSLHGYDIIDHTRVDPELGSTDALGRWSDALHQRGMGLVLDIVPNHMGIGADNAWWMNVLEHGPAAEYAEYFDIDWEPAKEELRGRVLLPVLEDHYGAVLDRGLLHLRFEGGSGSFEVSYHEQRFPLDAATYPTVLDPVVARLREKEGEHPHLPELESLLFSFGHLPARSEREPAVRTARTRDSGLLRARLAGLVERWPELRRTIEDELLRYDISRGGSGAAERLDRILDLQVWRVAYWRTAADEINYRRFFDINDLAALRQEREDVFDATHAYVLDLVRSGVVDGLRIDHPDGLFDPLGYCARLRDRLSGDRPQLSGLPPIWIVVEKILGYHEELPGNWAVHGTTGYEFSALVTALLVESAADTKLDTAYHRFIARRIEPAELVHDSKKLILDTALSSELNVLADAIDRISEADPHTRDFTRARLRAALAELISCFPVYRTYVTEADGPSADDRRHVEQAVAAARQRGRAVEVGIYDFLRDVLLFVGGAGTDEASRMRRARFVGQFQQVSGPVMAKGLEDTALYVHHRLLALNDVGSHPEHHAVPITAFHRANRQAMHNRPAGMLSTSTHDSKRSEDARSRLAALSEHADRWRREVSRFGRMNRSRKQRIDGSRAPSRNDEYAIYQNLLALWPADGAADPAALALVGERLEAATLKSVREAKVHSSWINPNTEYEDAVRAFTRSLFDPTSGAPFLEAFGRFAQPIIRAGYFNALTMQLLKLTSPGIPDLYQGTEVWRFSLVDPDNRRPVDFARRRAMLDSLVRFVDVDDADLPARVSEFLSTLADGRAKLYLTWRTLRLRRERPDLFARGEYLALEVEGPRAEHVIAFSRQWQGEHVAVIAPCRTASLCNLQAGGLPLGERAWRDTSILLPGGGVFRDLFSGQRFEASDGSLRLAEVLSVFPLALLLLVGSPSRSAQPGEVQDEGQEEDSGEAREEVRDEVREKVRNERPLPG